MIDAGRHEEADKILNKADRMARELGKTFTPILINRGILLIKKGEYQRAEERLNNALGNSGPSNFSDRATVNFALGNLMVTTRRPKRAAPYFKESLAADRTNGFHKGIADNLAALGSAYLSLDENEQAAKYFNRSIKIYALMGNEKTSCRIEPGRA